MTEDLTLPVITQGDAVSLNSGGHEEKSPKKKRVAKPSPYGMPDKMTTK
jgi:hypothetical protein